MGDKPQFIDDFSELGKQKCRRESSNAALWHSSFNHGVLGSSPSRLTIPEGKKETPSAPGGRNARLGLRPAVSYSTAAFDFHAVTFRPRRDLVGRGPLQSTKRRTHRS